MTKDELGALKTIAVDDLAPPPSQEDIFGKMDDLKSQCEKDNAEDGKQSKKNQVHHQ